MQNDYISIVVKYLYNYNRTKTTIENLQSQLAEKQEMQVTATAAIAKYGPTVGGGYSELNQVEAITHHNFELGIQVHEIMHEIGTLTGMMKRLDKALAALTSEGRNVIEWRYIKNQTWEVVAGKSFMSERKARKIAQEALQDIACMMFGHKAVGIGEYVFLK